LDPHNKDINEAVNFYLNHLHNLCASAPLLAIGPQKVRAEIKRRLNKNETSLGNFATLTETLRKMEARFGKTVVSEITAKDIRTWLVKLPHTAGRRPRR
jgi:hypothetical protein